MIGPEWLLHTQQPLPPPPIPLSLQNVHVQITCIKRSPRPCPLPVRTTSWAPLCALSSLVVRSQEVGPNKVGATVGIEVPVARSVGPPVGRERGAGRRADSRLQVRKLVKLHRLTFSYPGSFKIFQPRTIFLCLSGHHPHNLLPALSKKQCSRTS